MKIEQDVEFLVKSQFENGRLVTPSFTASQLEFIRALIREEVSRVLSRMDGDGK